MDDEVQTISTTALTPDIVETVFPIARSDRRKHKDLFVHVVPEDRLRDDKAFYMGLIRIIESDDLTPLLKYDAHVSKAGDHGKCLSYRAGRWLASVIARDSPQRRPNDLDPGHFDAGTPERAVHELYLGLTGRKKGRGARGTDSLQQVSPVTDHDPLADWTAVVRDLVDRAQALGAPDVEAAEKILAIAQSLVEAARTAVASDAERQRVAERAASLRDRARALDPAVAVDLQGEIASDWLDALETSLVWAEEARHAFRQAESASNGAHEELSAAVASREYTKAQTLSEKAEAAAGNARRAEGEWERARADLADVFGRGSGLDGSEDATFPTVQEPSAPEPDEHAPSPTVATAIATPAAANMDAPAIADKAEHVEPADDAEPDAPASTENEPAAPADEPRAASVAEPLPNSPDRENDVPPALETAPLLPEAVPERGKTDEPVEEAKPEPAALLAHYLDAGEIAFAWHVARLATTPVPAPIIRALAILPSVQQAEDMADPRRSSAVAELAASLPEATGPLAAARLALAALLRPALFDPDHGAREQLNNLLEHPALEAETQLSVLADLGHDVRLSTGLLAQLSGKPAPQAESTARTRLEDWLDEARRRKTLHQPTYAIFHDELKPEGEVGRTLEAVLDAAPEAETLARGMIGRLSSDRAAQELFVREAERRAGRPRRDRIEGTALEWFCRGLQEACGHLSSWLDARRQDSLHIRDQSRERLVRELGPVRKAIEAAKSPPRPFDDALERAAGKVLSDKLDDLLGLIDGRGEVGTVPRFWELLEAPLLRLPAGCQDWSDEFDPESGEERKERDRRLSGALASPESIPADLVEAFDAHLRERSALPARRILDRLTDSRLPASEASSRQQQLEEVVDASRRMSRDRVARLRQSLTTIGYLDQEAATALPGHLSKLALLDAALVGRIDGDDITIPAFNRRRRADVPPDFPALETRLGDMEVQRDRLRAQIAARQRQELDRLAGSSQGASARALLEKFDDLDPVTADDAIAELKAGRAVPTLEADAPDIFERFFHHFVPAIGAAGEVTRRGQIHTAIETRASAGPLDFRSVDARRAGRLKDLLEAWGRAENAMPRSQPGVLRDVLTKLFGLVGFTGVRLTEGREALPGRLRMLAMHCDVPRRTDGFLPPVFGSAAGGSYRLLLATRDVSLDQMLRQIGSEAPDAPWIVVLFSRMDVRERSRLARQLRNEARSALVLDETLLLFAGLESDDPLAAVLDCAIPFAWVQPYTTSPGRIPPEVFFGREAEISRIVSRNAEGCLIYGGRQLGKSVLLNHVRGERHRPDRGELALYMDIRSIGGPGVPADGIWQTLAHDLRRVTGLERVPRDPKGLLSAIETWLEHDPRRRMLAMFDESDNFLRAEHAAGYPNLLPLKGLMERTDRRFKAVFAGLHNVRRMARAPNSPLPHLGDPICIGPMNQSPANRAALRRLAVEPMRAAGLDYSEPGLDADMLARMNYYPSLIQVFGRQIVESCGRRPKATGTGPRWTLDRETLFEGEAAERIADQIRDRFQLTLNLDVRYDCIARSIALVRLESAGGDSRVLAQGMTVAEIRRVTYWPKVLSEPSMTDFEELLEELVDLGILSRFRDNRYGLRSAQVAQMLGGKAALEEALLRLDEREDEPAYDAALFFRSLRPEMPQARAPLTDRDLDRLFDPRLTGVRIVRWSEAVAGSDVAERLLAAARLWHPEGEHQRTGADATLLRGALDRVKATPAVLLIEGPLTSTSAAQLARQPRVAKGEILTIWCAPYSSAPFDGMTVFEAGCWSEPMLRHWLADEGLAPALDDAHTRASLIGATGGAPARIEACRQLLNHLAARPSADRESELAQWRDKNPFPVDALSLDAADFECLATLRDLETFDPTLDDILEQCPNATDGRLERLAALGLTRRGRTPDAAPIPTPLGLLVAQ